MGYGSGDSRSSVQGILRFWRQPDALARQVRQERISQELPGLLRTASRRARMALAFESLPAEF